jgi:hypothetical protein
MVSKMRYISGRLVYLSNPHSLDSIAKMLINVPGLMLQSEVAHCVATGDISRIKNYGTNAAQSAAQTMRKLSVSIDDESGVHSEVAMQSIAIFGMNGVLANPLQRLAGEDQLLKFATDRVDSDLMRSGNRFIRELSCLHGRSNTTRHMEMLGSAADPDEDLAFDALAMSPGSCSY